MSDFGFSVQKRIWVECGGKVDYETECCLGDRVGWRNKASWLSKDEHKYSLDALNGHLPTTKNHHSLIWLNISLFFSRIQSCKKGRRQRAEGRREEFERDFNPSQFFIHQIGDYGGAVDTLTPFSRGLQRWNQNSLLPSASCPLPFLVKIVSKTGPSK